MKIYKKHIVYKICAILLIFSIISSYFPSIAATVYNSGDVTITQSGDYEIQQGVTSIKVTGNINVNLVLNNVTINAQSTKKCPIMITNGATANVVLVGDNTLKAGYVTGAVSNAVPRTTSYGYAGLQVDQDSSVIIQGTGSLTAVGGATTANGYGGAGIGGGYNTGNYDVVGSSNWACFTPGNITINSGTITATGGGQAAGIGGGYNGATTAGNIIINGGNITANGGDWASGIGDGDSNQSYTNPDYGKEGGYGIIINGGTVNVKGGKQATGIGTTDELNSTLAGSTPSTLQIQILGGTVTSTGGVGAAAIGAGKSSIMEENSISIGKEVSLNCMSQGNSSISTDTITDSKIPSITLDEESFTLIARFSAQSSNREFKLLDSEGNVLKTNTILANYTSFTTELPGPGTYYIQIGTGGLIEITLEEGAGLVVGEVVNGVFVKDVMSAPLTYIDIYARGGSTSIVNNSYTFSPSKKTYDLYTKNGIEEVDIYFAWEKSNASDGVSTTVTVDGVETSYSTKNGVYYVTVPITVSSGNTIKIQLKKDDLNEDLTSNKYTVNVTMEDSYALELSGLNKIYDGVAVQPIATCTGALVTDEDLQDIRYTYYDIDGNLLTQAPKNAGNYQVKGILSKDKYIAESEQIEFYIEKRKISIKHIENYVKTEDGTVNLSDIQKNSLGNITYNDIIVGDTVGIQYNKQTSGYNSATTDANQITLYQVVVDNPNYIIDPTQTVYGEIISGMQSAIFSSDDGITWDKTIGSSVTKDCDTHNLAMRARTVGEGEDTAIYAIDVEWGTMEFNYLKGGWDTENHDYADGKWAKIDGQTNKVNVTNRSNRAVSLSADTAVEFQYSYDITLGLSENNISQYDAAQVVANSGYTRIINYKQPGQNDHFVTLYTVLSGELPDTSARTKIGSLTLKIEI